jgi:RNA polymerase sigma factor (sigma-70 family)
MSDDQVLLARYARSRDAGAFAQLVQRYSALVFSVASRVTRNSATAEDVAQDCFLRLSRQAATIRGSLPAWLHRVALNRSLDIKRNETARKRRESISSKPSDSDYDPTWDQIAPHVDAALAKLPDELREPLVQHFLMGRTQSQVALNLGIDQATISRRIHSGIELLRAHLKQAGVACGAVALPAILASNAEAAVPAQLSAALMKIALAGLTNTKNITLTTLVKGLIMKKTTCALIAATILVIVSIPLIVARCEQTNPAATAIAKESLLNGLVLHFTFDQAETGGKVTDQSGNHNDGKASGVQWTADGKKGGAYVFSADGQQIAVANNESLNPKYITVAAWIKTSVNDEWWRRIFDKSYSKGFALSIAGDWQKKSWRGLACMEIAPGPHVSYSKNVVANGQWHHLAVTFDGTQQLMYIDGKAQGKESWKKPGELGSTDFDLVIGCNRSNLNENDLGISFRGLIDEPMMWNRALAPDEVAFLFESQK